MTGKSRSVDINADLGEGFGCWKMGDDAALLAIVSSASIACGFHAGDPLIMHRTVQRALQQGVAIGAHPGFNDLQGFGRRRILGISHERLSADIVYQIGALQGIANACGGRLNHVKLHGALSNMACEDADLARICLRAVASIAPSLPVMVMPATGLAVAARSEGRPVISEIFADRAYRDDATLVPRHLEGALITDPQQVADRMLEAIETGELRSISGKRLPVEMETICVHGDSAAAVKMAAHLRQSLEQAGIRIAAVQAL